MISRSNWIVPSWAMLPWIIFTVCLTLHTAASYDNISTGKFLVYNGKSRPADISGCRTRLTVGSISCFVFCAQNISCAAVFIEAGASGTGSFHCHLCNEEWSISSLGAGTDRYAVSKFGGRGVPAPSVQGATLEKVEAHLGSIAAFYACPTGTLAREFEFAYDQQSGGWPQLSQACQETQTCKSQNRRGRDVYSGVLNTTVTGRTCQRWDTKSPHFHMYGSSKFLEDSQNTQAVGNFCRDPGNDGYVWCYTTDPGKRWDHCGVSDCV